MARKKSEKEYLEAFEKIHTGLYTYSKFPETFNQKTKINVYCKKHKEYFSVSINNLMNGHGCPKCGKESMAKTKGSHNQEKYKNIIEKNYSEYFDLSEINYKNCKYDKEKVFVTCKSCGKRQEKTIAELVHKRAGCLCNKQERMEWYHSEIREEQKKKLLEFSKEYFGERLTLLCDDYVTMDKKIKIHCNIDNYDFYVRASSFKYKYQGCPICAAKEKMSSFARVTMYYFDDNNIKYIPEYKISENEYLKNKPYDFYLEDYNLLVEIDGDQHRRPAFGRTQADVDRQKEIDKNKIIEGNKEGFQVLRLNTEEDFITILKNYLKSSTTIPMGVESSDSK